MYEFDYKKAKSVDEASKAHKDAEDASYLAGGMTLIPTLKFRLAAPSDLVDLSGLDDLRGIEVNKDGLIIGAMTRHAEVAGSKDVQKAIPALAALAGGIGDPMVRNRGTMGGSIANNDPAADYPGAVVALKATVHTDQREIDAEDFFTGMFETALEEGELITRVTFRIPDKAAYMKFPNPASRYAIAGSFVAKFGDEVRVAITGAGPTAFRVTEYEEALARDFSPKAIEGIEIPTDDLNADIHASKEYRAHLIGVMTKRAVEACK